ncbi:hypothetical protein BJ165DRAFT_776917 [Panaeolus papilionaceus]|nr:hypothetical protein BJ165DRAFT_776917 [Panaeolus papilionaceus]
MPRSTSTSRQGRATRTCPATTTALPNGAAQITFQVQAPTNAPTPQQPQSQTHCAPSQSHLQPSDVGIANVSAHITLPPMPTTPHRGGQDASGDSSTMNSPGNIFQTGNDAQSRPNHPNHVTFATTDPVSSSANTAIPPTRNAQGNQIQQMTPAATSSSPLRSHRSPGSPKIGRHSTHHASSSSPRQAQAAPKSTGARDVWTFYKKVGLTRECIFCQYVISSSQYLCFMLNYSIGSSATPHPLTMIPMMHYL